MNKCLTFLLTVVLAACQVIPETPLLSPAEEIDSNLPTAPPTIVPTDTAALASPSPSTTPIPPTETPVTVSVTPTIISMEQGITWTECIAPVNDYDHHAPDYEFAHHCLNMERPGFDDKDRSIMGERIEDSNGSNLKQVIGNDVYLVKHDSTNGCCDYQLLKNGNVLLSTQAPSFHLTPIDIYGISAADSSGSSLPIHQPSSWMAWTSIENINWRVFSTLISSRIN